MIDLISSKLNLNQQSVANVVKLSQDGSSIPFITRYRKEQTGNMDELQIGAIVDMHKALTEIDKRKQSILTTLQKQGVSNPTLLSKIEQTYDLQVLEDLYAPYKPKRKTRASIAIEKGLKPLAKWMWQNPYKDPSDTAYSYLSDQVTTEQDAIQGASDIIAEQIAEDSNLKGKLRTFFARQSVVTAKVVKAKETDAQLYREYFDYTTAVRRIAAHAIHALLRGNKEGLLKITAQPDADEATERMLRHLKWDSHATLYPTVIDAYKRLLRPSLEKELLKTLKDQADEEAIGIFSSNLRQLLLESPLGKKNVLALDPGFRTGCKVACIDSSGQYQTHTVVYPTGSAQQQAQAAQTLKELVKNYQIDAIAIGNGTASRETEQFVRQLSLDPIVQVVNESGASIYSVSEVARDEFPNLPETTRSAISIGRRFQDPLAELVKIDAKSLGIGQYQHDVDQKRLHEALDRVVESAVNHVGVNLNTASTQLLRYVSGLNATLTQNIIDFRDEHGEFTTRNQLKKVKGMGKKSFEQAAGFLRIPTGSNPLDNTAVHPESYALVDTILQRETLGLEELTNRATWQHISLKKYTSANVGLATLSDIKTELLKPGRDPREQFSPFSFSDEVNTITDLQVGMVLPGIVSNITKFGAFVDIGVHQDGLVHISQLSSSFVSDITQVVKLRQEVQVKVLEIDESRKRISLSMNF